MLPPNQSPEPIPTRRDTAVSRGIGIHVASRRWLSFFRCSYTTMENILLTLVFSFLLVGCSTNNPVGATVGARPDAATSEFLKTKGGGFSFDVDDRKHTRTCQYSLLLTPTKRVTPPLYLTAEFENPAGGAPLIAYERLQPDESEVLIVSPPVSGLQFRKVYRVDVSVYSDASRSSKISTHTQFIQSFLNF